MIRNVEDLHIVESIVEKAGEINGMDKKVLRKMLINSFFEDRRFLMIDSDSDKLNGIMFATVEEFDGIDVAFIQICWSDKTGNVQSMLDKLIDWAHGLGLKKLVFMSNRSPEAWARKYKFQESYRVMTRGI